MTSFVYFITTDGTVIVRDLSTGHAVSGRSLVEALAELRRLLEHGARGREEKAA